LAQSLGRAHFLRDETRRCRFLEENAAKCDLLRDYITALEYDHSNLTPRIREDQQKPIFLTTPLYYEKSSPPYKNATAKSFAV